jgi:hypothetical protein
MVGYLREAWVALTGRASGNFHLSRFFPDLIPFGASAAGLLAHARPWRAAGGGLSGDRRPSPSVGANWYGFHGGGRRSWALHADHCGEASEAGREIGRGFACAQ